MTTKKDLKVKKGTLSFAGDSERQKKLRAKIYLKKMGDYQTINPPFLVTFIIQISFFKKIQIVQKYHYKDDLIQLRDLIIIL